MFSREIEEMVSTNLPPSDQRQTDSSLNAKEREKTLTDPSYFRVEHVVNSRRRVEHTKKELTNTHYWQLKQASRVSEWQG